MNLLQLWVTVVSVTAALSAVAYEHFSDDSKPTRRSAAYGVRALPNIEPEDFPTIGVILLQLATQKR